MTREMMMTQRCINKRQGHLLPAALPLDLSPRTEGKVMMIMVIMVMMIMMIMVMVIIKMMIIIMVIFTLAVLVTTDRGQSNHHDNRDDH